MKLFRWQKDRLERALELYEEEDLTYMQIARRMGESRNTIKRALAKARRMREESR